VLGEAYRHVMLDQFAEVRRWEQRRNSIDVGPRLFLIWLQPDLPLNTDRQKVAACKLRVVRKMTGPVPKRVVRKLNLVDDRRIHGVVSRGDRCISKRVVDAEIAQLHATEIVIGGRGATVLLQLFALIF